MIRIAAAVALGLAVPPAMAGEGSGAFTGQSGHATSGGVEVVETAAGWEVRLGPDFSFDGAPDPRVGFGRDGRFAADTDFEPLRRNAGAQVYAVPDALDPADYDEVYIWCRQYAVPLGVAKIAE